MSRDGDPQKAQQTFEEQLDPLECRQEEAGGQKELRRLIQVERLDPQGAHQARRLGVRQGSGEEHSEEHSQGPGQEGPRQDRSQDRSEVGGERACEGRRRPEG
jgi:hypothetical protein